MFTSLRPATVPVPRLATRLGASLAIGLIAGTAIADVDEADFSLRTTQSLYDLCAVSSDDDDFAPAIYACRSFLEATVQHQKGYID
jgi:hypothetical protein